MTDLQHLIADKYDGNQSLVTEEDTTRLASGEPLAYIIGWIPFLGIRVQLDSHPLIPRPETEWWTEKLADYVDYRYGTKNINVLDLCAGSGAIGLSLSHLLPHAIVHLAELEPTHIETIKKSIELNTLDTTRITVSSGDLFEYVPEKRFDIIACNPPYIPSDRTLETSVTSFESGTALFSGTDGLDLIRRIATEVPTHLREGGELWLEADIDNIEEASKLLKKGGAMRTIIHTDQYERPRLVVAYY